MVIKRVSVNKLLLIDGFYQYCVNISPQNRILTVLYTFKENEAINFAIDLANQLDVEFIKEYDNEDSESTSGSNGK